MQEYNANRENRREIYSENLAVPAACYAWDEGLDRDAFLISSKRWGVDWGRFLLGAGHQRRIWGSIAEKGCCYGHAEACANFFWLTVAGFLELGMQLYDRIIKTATLAMTEKDYALFILFLESVNKLHETQLNQAFLMPTGREQERDVGRILLHSEVGLYSQEDLKTYFQCSMETLGAQPFELFLSSGNHAVSLCFCSLRKEWLFFDYGNEAAEVFGARNFEDLSVRIMKKLYGNNSFVIFHTKIIDGLPRRNLLSKKIPVLQRDKRWKAIHMFNSIKAHARDLYSFSALIIAAQNGSALAVQILLDAGADINAASHTGATALYMASQNGHSYIIPVLISGGADIHAPLKNNITVLHGAAAEGRVEVVRLLVANGANMHAVSDDGSTPLSAASQNGHIDVVRFLVEQGAEVNTVSDDGGTALFIASQNGHMEVVRFLLQSGANINIYFYSTAENLLEFFHTEESKYPGVTERLRKFLVNRAGKIQLGALDIAEIMHGETSEICAVLKEAHEAEMRVRARGVVFFAPHIVNNRSAEDEDALPSLAKKPRW